VSGAGRRSALHHFEAVEPVFPLRDCGDGPHRVDGGHLGAAVIAAEQHRFGGEAQLLSGDLRRLGGGGGSGGGGPLGLQQGGELGEGGGGHGLGLHAVAFSDRTTGNPPAGAGGNGHRQGDNARLPFRCQLPFQKKRAGGLPPARRLFPQHLPQQQQQQQDQERGHHATVTVPRRASASASFPTLTMRSHPPSAVMAEANADLRSALPPNSEDCQRENESRREVAPTRPLPKTSVKPFSASRRVAPALPRPDRNPTTSSSSRLLDRADRRSAPLSERSAANTARASSTVALAFSKPRKVSFQTRAMPTVSPIAVRLASKREAKPLVNLEEKRARPARARRTVFAQTATVWVRLNMGDWLLSRPPLAVNLNASPSGATSCNSSRL